MACILPEYADKFLDGLRNGEINPESLVSMTSEQRRDFLSKYVGKENAKFVNTEFEGKLLLKNQKEGMINWAKKTAGLKPSIKKDILDKINKLDRALNTEEENMFLSDIVEKRLGVDITAEEAKTIIDLTNKMKSVYENRFNDPNKSYFRYKKNLLDFMKENAPETPESFGKHAADVLSVMRAVKTGFDLSASLRQGASYFGTKQWNNSFQRMFGYAQSQTNLDELEIEMMSHKYTDEAMSVKRELGLTMLGESFTQREEAFASQLIKKVPFLKGSARAYEGFLNDLRFHRFVDILQTLDDAGNSITKDKQAMKDLAEVIAAASGRGNLGSAELAARSLATVMFSPRWLASRIQILLNPIAKRGVAQKEAAKSLARLAGLSVSILGMAKAMGADVEDDPRSSDFGKIKVQNTRFDVTGGISPYIVLLARQIKGESKSTVTGKVSKLGGDEFGSKTRLDVMTGFLQNKTSPVASVIRDILKGENFEGEKINLDQPPQKLLVMLADAMITPLLISDVIEAFNQSSDNKIVMGTSAGVSSIMGIGVNSYQFTPKGKKWEVLKKQIGEDKYNDAINMARELLSEKLEELNSDPEFKEAPETGDNSKANMIDLVRKETNEEVLDYFGYEESE